MIVEFIGCSGAGKSTLVKMLRDRTGAADPVILTTDLVLDRPGRRWINHPKAVNLVADATALPSFLRALGRNGDFVRFAFHRLRRYAPSTFEKYNYMREIVRHVGLYELAQRAGARTTILADEGTVLTAYHLFVYSDAPFDRADLDRFARLVPLPDRIVHVRAPLDVLVARSMRRPDRRRELASDERRHVKRWVARAQEVFDDLVRAPEIRDRVLIVDNLDGSPDDRQATVARIAEFINQAHPDWRAGSAASGSRRRPALAAGGVIAFVGSEATGKSTILNEIEGWLSTNHAIRRIHAGKPPGTPLTLVPHVLLPALRALFPEQRSLPVEARYAGSPETTRQTYPMLFALRSVMLAYERRVLLCRARARAADGTIVLSDRYPSSRSGATDSAQLGHLPSGRGSLRRRLAALEARLYRDIPAPDLVIHVTAPLEVTLARNAERPKTEPEAFVRFRHSLSTDPEFDGAAVHRIDTDRPLEAVVRDVKEVVQTHLNGLPLDTNVLWPADQRKVDG
jgi:thymidylate kinase